MSLLRPGVIKQHKSNLSILLLVTAALLAAHQLQIDSWQDIEQLELSPIP